jgi:hypothetical protein
MNEVFSHDAAEHLHSRYNPRAEAERYLDALTIGGGVAYFILIEPGLGYLVPALQSRYADSKIIVLHADSRFRAGTADQGGVSAWFPDSGEPVRRFLEREIPDVAASSVKIIEWRPSLRFYGEACLSLLAQTVEFIKRADAGFRTAAAFGGKWVANVFRNLRLIRHALRFQPMTVPVIITGSGPGLEQALPRIFAMRDHAFILAASSSVLALRENGIAPDMVISTDGGSWALSHLYPCFRAPLPNGKGPLPNGEKISRNGKGPAPARAWSLAAALSAAIPSQCAAVPFLALNDGSLWQSLILHELAIPSVIIPQAGTVAASALELALALSSGTVYLAGLDLSVRDIRTHVRPYGFDHLFFGAASRLRPVYSQCFARSGDTRRGGSHAVYAAWFKNQLAAWPRRIFSLGNNHAVFADGVHRAANDRRRLPAGAENTESCFSLVPIGGQPEANCARGAQTLLRALDDPRYAKTIRDELAPLVFPGKKDVSGGELGEALRAMTERHGREDRGYAFLF